jgi:hypothetical protein
MQGASVLNNFNTTSKGNMMEYADEVEEMVSVGELFEEELDLLIDQYQFLTEKNTEESLMAADSLAHVINYFRIRLGIEEGIELEDVYGAGRNETLH